MLGGVVWYGFVTTHTTFRPVAAVSIDGVVRGSQSNLDNPSVTAFL